MEVHLQIIHPRDFVVAKTNGVLDRGASISMLSKIVEDSPEGQDFLFDLREVEKFANTTLDVIEIVSFMLDHRKTFRFKIAILAEPGQGKNPDFFEDFAYNRGLDVRIFRNFELAIMWLLRSSPEK